MQKTPSGNQQRKTALALAVRLKEWKLASVVGTGTITSSLIKLLVKKAIAMATFLIAPVVALVVVMVAIVELYRPSLLFHCAIASVKSSTATNRNRCKSMR